MKGSEYQKLAMRTASANRSKDIDLLIATLGLAGESGEVCDQIKKWAGHGHTLDREKLKEELGDLLWYIARIAEWHTFSLDDIMEENIAKLKRRYPEGFSSERSINRDS